MFYRLRNGGSTGAEQAIHVLECMHSLCNKPVGRRGSNKGRRGVLDGFLPSSKHLELTMQCRLAPVWLESLRSGCPIKVESEVTSVHGRVQGRNRSCSFGKTFALPASIPDVTSKIQVKNTRCDGAHFMLTFSQGVHQSPVS